MIDRVAFSLLSAAASFRNEYIGTTRLIRKNMLVRDYIKKHLYGKQQGYFQNIPIGRLVELMI